MTTMTLPDAIRLGAMSRPQSLGMIGKSGGVCAIGAALLAAGRLCEPHCEDNYGFAVTLWPQLIKLRVRNPADGNHDQLLWVITNLNDVHQWTREQIADFVESLERAQPRAGTVQPEQETVAPSASAAQ